MSVAGIEEQRRNENQKREERAILEIKEPKKELQSWGIEERNTNENNESNLPFLENKENPWTSIWKNKNKNKKNFLPFFFIIFLFQSDFLCHIVNEDQAISLPTYGEWGMREYQQNPV